MTGTTSSFAAVLTPQQVGDLVIRPLVQESVAGQILTTVHTANSSYRIPVVTADPSASFVPEAGEIPVSDASVTEIDVQFSKLAGLSVISRELANDSSPAAAEVVGQGLTRDLTRKLDQALWSATTADGPGGIPGVSGVTAVSAGASYANVDAFSDAIYQAAQYNGNIDYWISNPSTAAALAKVKELSGSNKPLLGPDPAMPGQRQILGVPLLTSPYISTTNNPVWGVSKAFSYLVIREDAQVESDRSVFFTSDRVAIKATVRLSFAFAAPATIVKITTS